MAKPKGGVSQTLGRVAAKTSFKGLLGGAKLLFTTADTQLSGKPDLQEEIATELAPQATKFIEDGVKGAGANIRNQVEPFSQELKEGLNPNNADLWVNIKDTVVGNSKGLGRIFRYIGAAVV